MFMVRRFPSHAMLVGFPRAAPGFVAHTGMLFPRRPGDSMDLCYATTNVSERLRDGYVHAAAGYEDLAFFMRQG
jgi:hypothetical protein